MLASAPVSAQALKTAKLCNDEYAAQKPALKAAKETKKEFVTSCRALPIGTATPVGSVAAASTGPAPGAAPSAPAAPSGQVKTAGACEAEYKANKDALKGAKEKKRDFVAACRALPPGAATPIGTAAATPAPVPSRSSASGTGSSASLTGAVHASRTRYSNQDDARSACSGALRSEPVLRGSRRQGALPQRHRRLGEHAIEDLPFRGDEELREHEGRCLHVRNRCDRGRGSRIRDRKASMMEAGASRAYAEEVYVSCATIGFANDDVQALKAMLDSDDEPDAHSLLELAKRTQAEAVRWATSG